MPEDTPVKPTILLWSWRHGALDVDDDFDTLDEAVSSWYWRWEGDDCAPDRIEVWDEQGAYRLIEVDEATALAYAYEVKIAREHPPKPRPVPVAYLWIATPEGSGVRSWSLLMDYTEQAKADEELARFTPLLGDRVQVTNSNWRPPQ